MQKETKAGFMPTQNNIKFFYEGKPSLPDLVITPSGLEIDISSNIWIIPVQTHTSRLIFGDGPLALLSPELKQYGYERLSTVSTSVSRFTLSVWLNQFSNFLKSKHVDSIQWSNLTVKLFEEFLQHLRDKGVGYYFWHIQSVISWIQLNCPTLISEKLVTEVTSWTVEGNTKGEAVALNDPFLGALTNSESNAIRTAALNLDSPVTLLERAVVLLLLETGQRNEQICNLETTDLKIAKFKTEGDARHFQPEQAVRHLILMPSNKTSEGKRELSISPELFKICFELAKSNRNLLSEVSGNPLLIINPAKQSVYKAWFDADKERWSKIRRPNSWDLNSIVKYFCEKCGILDRSGDSINIFARRFRRTIATRLVEQGASPEEVAALLDHADTQQVMVYFEFHQHRKQQRLEEAAGPFFRSLGDSIKGN